MATRATPGWTWCSGSSAFHTPRRATTCSACSRTCRTIAPASARRLSPSTPTSSVASPADWPMANDRPPPTQPRDFYYASNDGLRLYARDYGDLTSSWSPVVCLPGLSRTSRDFHSLALYLSGHYERPRRVVAFDYRGRGRSQWDKNAANYNVAVEMGDVLDGMAALGIPRAVVVGTSRGGIIGMLMAFARPQTIAGLALNDIGPFIEPRGLARLKAYIGRTPRAENWADAARIQRRLHGPQFTAFDDTDWDGFARRTYNGESGRPENDYDPNLSETLKSAEIDQP